MSIKSILATITLILVPLCVFGHELTMVKSGNHTTSNDPFYGIYVDGVYSLFGDYSPKTFTFTDGNFRLYHSFGNGIYEVSYSGTGIGTGAIRLGSENTTYIDKSFTLPDGLYTFSFSFNLQYATRSDGTVSTERGLYPSRPFQVRIDTTAPTLALSTKGPNWQKTQNVVVTASDGNGTGIQSLSYVDPTGGSHYVVGSVFSGNLNPSGIYRFTARDNVGLTKSLDVEIRTDNTVPDLSVTGVPIGTPSNPGGWVNHDVTLSVVGSDPTGVYGAESGLAGLWVSTNPNAGTPIWQALAGSSTSYVVSATSSVRFKAVDVAGNETLSPIYQINIDKVYPVVSVTDGKTGALVAGVDTITNGATDAGGSSLSSFKYTVNGGSAFNAGAALSLSTSGPYTVVFTAEDMAGNVTMQTLTRYVLVNPPWVEPESFAQWQNKDDPEAMAVTGKDDSGRKHTDSPSHVWLAYSVDGKSVSDGSKSWTVVAGSTVTLGEGDWTVDWRVTDEAGQVVTRRDSIVVDRTLPSLVGTVRGAALKLTEVNYARSASEVVVTAGDLGSKLGSSFSYEKGSEASVLKNYAGGSATSKTIDTRIFGVGKSRYKITATDLAGNSEVLGFDLVVDATEVPQGNVVVNATKVGAEAVKLTGTASPLNFTNLAVTLTGQGVNEAPATKVKWQIDSGAVNERVLTSAEAVEDLGAAPEGPHTLKVWVEDSAGNVNADPWVYQFNADRTAPALGANWRSWYTFTAGGRSVVVAAKDPGEAGMVLKAGGTEVWNQSVKTGYTKALAGDTDTVTLVAVDAAGNSSSVNVTLVYPVAATPVVTKDAIAAVAASSTPASYRILVSGPETTRTVSGVTYTVSYLGGNGTSSIAPQVVSGQIYWRRDELKSSLSLVAGQTLQVTKKYTKTGTDSGLAVSFDSTSGLNSYLIPKSLPVVVYTDPGSQNWVTYLNGTGGAVTRGWYVSDPDGGQLWNRYVVSYGTSGASYTVVGANGQASQDLSSLSWKQGTPSAPITIKVQIWGGETAPGASADWNTSDDVLSVTNTWDATKVDLVNPVIDSVGSPWATGSGATWSNASSFTVAVSEGAGESGVAAVTATATKLDAGGHLTGTPVTLTVGALTSQTIGTRVVTQATVTIPKTLAGSYQLSLTVTDTAGNWVTDTSRQAKLDYAAPVVTGMTMGLNQVSGGGAWYADELGTVKGTLTVTGLSDDGDSPGKSWEYQVGNSSVAWQTGGTYFGGSINFVPVWGTQKTLKLRWRVTDTAGNVSVPTESNWVTVQYDPSAPSFELTVSGLGGQGDHYVSGVSAVGMTLTPGGTQGVWRAGQVNADGSRTWSVPASSWAALQGLDGAWSSGQRYVVQVEVSNGNGVSSTKESSSFVLDTSAPSAVSASLVAPETGRSSYHQGELFAVDVGGGSDVLSPVDRRVDLVQVVGGHETLLSSQDVGAGVSRVTMDWGTGGVNWSQGGFGVRAVATNAAGLVTTSSLVGVTVSGQGIVVRVPDYIGNAVSYPVSWDASHVGTASGYVLVVYKVVNGQPEEAGRVEGLGPLERGTSVALAGLSDGQQVYAKVSALDDQGSELETGLSVKSNVDSQGPQVGWLGNLRAVSSAKVGGSYRVQASSSGVADVKWQIEKLVNQQWQTVGGWREGGGLQSTVSVDAGSGVAAGDRVRLTVRAESGTGQLGQAQTGALLVDDTAPPVPLVMDQGLAVNPVQSLKFQWLFSAPDGESGIVRYDWGWFYRGLASEPSNWTALSDTRLASGDWRAEVNLSTDGTALDGRVVVMAVRAVNAAGLESVGYSDGIVLDRNAPHIYEIKSYTDSSMANELKGYVKASQVSSGTVFVKMGAVDDTWLAGGTVTAKKWNTGTNQWDSVGSPEGIEGDSTPLAVAGGMGTASLWRFEAQRNDAAGNISEVAVSEGFEVSGTASSVRGLQVLADSIKMNLSWNVDNEAGSRWVRQYNITAQTSKGGTFTQSVEGRNASFVWGSGTGGLGLDNLDWVTFSVVARGVAEDSPASTNAVDYSQTVTVDKTPPQLGIAQMPLLPATQFYDRIEGRVSYQGSVGVSSLQWSAELVTDGRDLVDWQEQTWMSQWDISKLLSDLTSVVPANQWAGKQIRLKYRAANSMGLWSPVSYGTAVKVDPSGPGTMSVSRASRYSNETTSVSGWTMNLNDDESGILSYRAKLVPTEQAAGYQWPGNETATGVSDTAAGHGYQGIVSIPLPMPTDATGNHDYTPLLLVQNGTGHWFAYQGDTIHMDWQPPAVTSQTWAGAAAQTAVRGGVSQNMLVVNGPNQSWSLQASEPVTWSISDSWLTTIVQPASGYSQSASGTLVLSGLAKGVVYPLTIQMTDQAGNVATTGVLLRYNQGPQVTINTSALTVNPGVLTSVTQLVSVSDEDVGQEGDYPLTYTWTPGGAGTVQTWTGGSTLGQVWGTQMHQNSWSQVPAQAQTTNHTGTLRVTDRYGQSSQVDLAIKVENTHQGNLTVSEYWSGSFALTGTVIVPTGKTLTLDAAQLTVNGSLVNGYLDSTILVQPGGRLVVSNTGAGSVSHIQSAIDGRLWRGLRIQGSLEGEGLEVVSAQRGITVESGGSVNLTNSLLMQNGTGAHLYGGTFSWVGGSIASSLEYGVKEDLPGVYSFTSTTFSTNPVHYYQRSRTVIDINQLNAIPNNSLNTEAH